MGVLNPKVGDLIKVTKLGPYLKRLGVKVGDRALITKVLATGSPSIALQWFRRELMIDESESWSSAWSGFKRVRKAK